MAQNTLVETKRPARRALLVGGVVAGPLFTLAWIVAGALTPDYDPLRHQISMLVLGEFGWLQTASFFVSGLLILGFGIGLRRAARSSRMFWGPLLIALAGIGLIGAGIFATDPALGFPPGTPIIPTEVTTHGMLHNLFASLFYFGPPIAGFFYARYFGKRGQRALAIYSVASGIAFFASYLILARLTGTGADAPFGLNQRIVITINLLWLTVLGVSKLVSTRQEALA
jgi:hypothetical membrane protein